MEKAIKCTYGIGFRLTHHDTLVFQNIVDDLEYTVHCHIEIDLFGRVSHQWRQELGIRSQIQFRQYFHIARPIHQNHPGSHYLHHTTRKCECNKTDSNIWTHCLRMLEKMNYTSKFYNPEIRINWWKKWDVVRSKLFFVIKELRVG